MDDYEQYEYECKRIRSDNQKLLENFSQWLSQKKLSKSTIESHVGNINFYVNEFLLYEDAQEVKEAVHSIGWFLGDWFIRKAMWASESSIKQNAASLKKFYQFLSEKGEVDFESLQEMKESIKDEMPQWLETLRRYDDPEIDDVAEIWGFK